MNRAGPLTEEDLLGLTWNVDEEALLAALQAPSPRALHGPLLRT